MLDSLNPLAIARSLDEYWSPKVIGEIDNNFIKVVKVKGSLVWHFHENEDELFFLLQGTLNIHYRDKCVTLNTGEIHVVPKGVDHLPVAEEECLILLIEKKTTQHTGNIEDTKTKTISQQLQCYLPNTKQQI